MFTTPAATPTTIPFVAPTVAMAVFEDVHKPPGVALVKGVVKPAQTVLAPEIAAGAAVTVTDFIIKQPPPIL